MSVKRINITHLLESGKRLNPVDLIIDYRYRILTDKKITVSVWGTSNNKGYICLGHQDLTRPTDFRVPAEFTKDFNTEIFQLKQKHTATGLFIFIDNAEYVEFKRIDFIFNEASKLTGREMECDPFYPPLPEKEFSVNPFAFTDIPFVTVFNVNPFVISEVPSVIMCNVNPFVLTVIDMYQVNPFIYSIADQFTVNPFTMSAALAYNVNPFVFKEYELFSINPFVLFNNDDPMPEDVLMYVGHFLTDAPVMPEDVLTYVAEYYVPPAPTITKVDNTIVMT